MVQPLWKTVELLLKKLNIEYSYHPEIPLLGIYPKELKTFIQTNTCTCMFIASLLTAAKRWKQPKGPSVAKQIVVYTYNGILFSHKKG